MLYCPYCKVELEELEFRVCLYCKTKIHIVCWQINKERCTTFGCLAEWPKPNAKQVVVHGKPFMSIEKLRRSDERTFDIAVQHGLITAKKLVELRDIELWSKIAVLSGNVIKMLRDDSFFYQLLPVFTVFPDGTFKYDHPEMNQERKKVYPGEQSKHPSYLGYA